MTRRIISYLTALAIFAGTAPAFAERQLSLAGGLPDLPQISIGEFKARTSGELQLVRGPRQADPEDEEDEEESESTAGEGAVDADAAALNVAMGAPTGATADPSQETDYLMPKTEYVLSYNNVTHNPNWVSWHVNKSWISDNVERQNNFRPDPTLNELVKTRGWVAVTKADYNRTGFDRGHMCNSKDRTRDSTVNDNTFFMTNMVPQAPANNQKTWMWLEAQTRDWATAEGDEKEVFVVSGPAGRGGDGVVKGKDKDTGKNETRPVQADGIPLKRNGRVVGEINVPKCTWKVMLILPAGKTSPSDVTEQNAQVVAVIMPNSESIIHAKKDDWKKYQVSVKQVEDMLRATTPAGNMKWPTSYSFFSKLNPSVAQRLKQQNASRNPTTCN
ncbi:MAG: DNA/RNA non-specific endonuclease [Elusimicrobia bacterium]|nr:DNA/RNA non-specific endonuclease [Elusimicrobiota bacterium]